VTETHISFSEAVDSNPDHQNALMNLGIVAYHLDNLGGAESFRSVFPKPGAEHSLGAWHEYEFGHPRTFSAMYQFWISKPAPCLLGQHRLHSGLQALRTLAKRSSLL